MALPQLFRPQDVPLSKSAEYESFRSSVALKKVAVDDRHPDKVWTLYECGPRERPFPLVCLPPVSGTADCFFLQCMALAAKGHRVIAAESPAYWSADEWCDGFLNLLSHLQIEKVHLFGAALGGFLAQKFAQFTQSCPRVASLVLCNTFLDTSIFKFADQASLFFVMPSTFLKGLIMGGLETESADPAIQRACAFMEERLDSLCQAALASRLSINCATSRVQPDAIKDLPVTIIDVWDESALTQQVKEDVQKAYPNAKMALLKSGGNFPFLSRSDEVNLHLTIHLRNFDQGSQL